jgi:cytochrome c peroxidase
MSQRGLWLGVGLVVLAGVGLRQSSAGAPLPTPTAQDVPKAAPGYDWQVPDERLLAPFAERSPIYFVNRTQNLAEWTKLPKYWNEFVETATDPVSGQTVQRKAVKIKVPLGLSQNPPVPPENPMTVGRWKLGKKLFFDPILSSDNSVSCATCHDPRHGYTDRSPVSTGIFGNKGGVSSPPVLNAAYNHRQFWDGRAGSLEDQAQGPVQNPLEMFDAKGHPWDKAVSRVRNAPEYVKAFEREFGTPPTRDAIAKCIASYERTILSGNSLFDRADLAMKFRVADEEGTKFEIQPKDFEKVLREAFAGKDKSALDALGLKSEKDVPTVAKQLSDGRALFFGKARCNSCHVGDNFTDNQFHNLGVGVKDGKIPDGAEGRFAQLPTGHKDFVLFGAWKTPTLRGLAYTPPYMHDGSEKTLEEVIELYDRGGNANEFLDTKMRDFDAEKAYLVNRLKQQPYKGPQAFTFGPDSRPVVPLRLNLTPQEKRDLVLFLRALQGDDVDPVVAR